MRMIGYKAKSDAAAQNRKLIENVFAELQEKSPDGVRYMVLTLANGSFFHFVETSAAENPLLKLDAFKLFQSGVRERCAEPPQVNEATIVGNYRMLEA